MSQHARGPSPRSVGLRVTETGLDEGPHVVALVGPTGVGKTAAAVALAARLPVEVVSVDSRQVYRLMDIGTAKPDAAQRMAVRHHLVDVVDPDEPYDAGRFAREARAAVADIRSRGRVPLLVGGTGLYLRALTAGTLTAPPSDAAVRESLYAEEAASPGALRRRLREEDPAAADRIHANDLVRTVRALEVIRATGAPFSSLAASRAESLPVRIVALRSPRERLNRLLDRRVDRMMEAGFLDEVRRLLGAGYGPRLRSMRGIGYRQLAAHLAGEATLEEAVNETRLETRRLAKRQMTWFRGTPGVEWVDLADPASPGPAVEAVLAALSRRAGTEAG